MQVFPPQPLHYTPLLLLIFLNLSGASLSHMLLLGLLILLKPTTTRNYCNAAVSVLLIPMLLFLNIYDSSQVIYKYN